MGNNREMCSMCGHVVGHAHMYNLILNFLHDSVHEEIIPILCSEYCAQRYMKLRNIPEWRAWLDAHDIPNIIEPCREIYVFRCHKCMEQKSIRKTDVIFPYSCPRCGDRMFIIDYKRSEE